MLDAARTYFYLFGALTIAGGVMGFVKARSPVSLAAGGAAGLLLLVAAYALPQPLGFVVALAVSIALLGRFLPAYIKSRKPMPAGVMAAFSGVGVAVAVLAWIAP